MNKTMILATVVASVVLACAGCAADDVQEPVQEAEGPTGAVTQAVTAAGICETDANNIQTGWCHGFAVCSRSLEPACVVGVSSPKKSLYCGSAHVGSNGCTVHF